MFHKDRGRKTIIWWIARDTANDTLALSLTPEHVTLGCAIITEQKSVVLDE